MIAAVTLLGDNKADAELSALKTSISGGRGYLGWPYVLPRDIKVNQWGIPEHLTSGDPLVSEVSPEVAGVMSSKDDGSPAPPQSSSRIAVTRWSPEIKRSHDRHAAAGLDSVSIVSISGLACLR